MSNIKGVLVTGGSGMIGSRLRSMLASEGYSTFTLGRKPTNIVGHHYHWDPVNMEIDTVALEKSPVIVHLAGASVGSGRWTRSRRQEILNSRVHSSELLHRSISMSDRKPSVLVSASAIGYYGDRGDEALDEDSSRGEGFLADVTDAWEDAVSKIADLGVRVVTLRIGMVISPSGGALDKISAPIRIYAGSPLGSGKQYVSWIHIDDLSRIILRAISDPSMEGTYNATAPHPVTNKELTIEVARALGRSIFLPPAPSLALRLALGQMADLVLHSQRVLPKRLENSGFHYLYPDLPGALKAVFHRPAKI